MSHNTFGLEMAVAERLYESIHVALPKISMREKAEIAQTVINTLSMLPPYELANFHNAMVDYITLPKQSKIEVLSILRRKVTEVRIG